MGVFIVLITVTSHEGNGVSNQRPLFVHQSYSEWSKSSATWQIISSHAIILMSAAMEVDIVKKIRKAFADWSDDIQVFLLGWIAVLH